MRAWLHRVEFQEGTRSRGPNAARPNVPQRDGTGLPHVHLLVCNLPVQQQPTHWTLGDGDQRWQLRVQRSQASKDACVRPHFQTLCLARLCHQDVQVVRNAADVMQYTAAYVRYSTKASSALSPTMLVQGTSGVQAAYGMLRHLAPSAAQMVASLHSESLCTFSCYTKEVHVPSLETCQLHPSFGKYVRRARRPRDMCFVEWLRSYREDLETPRPYRKTRGFGCAVGVLYASRFSDFFCGQWLCAWRPWSDWPRLPEECRRLPTDYCNFHACRLLAPEFWGDLENLGAELKLEGHRLKFIEAVKAHYHAAAEVCDLIRAGQLQWHSAAERPHVADLAPDQRGFYEEVLHEIREWQVPCHGGAAWRSIRFTQRSNLHTDWSAGRGLSPTVSGQRASDSGHFRWLPAISERRVSNSVRSRKLLLSPRGRDWISWARALRVCNAVLGSGRAVLQSHLRGGFFAARPSGRQWPRCAVSVVATGRAENPLHAASCGQTVQRPDSASAQSSPGAGDSGKTDWESRAGARATVAGGHAEVLPAIPYRPFAGRPSRHCRAAEQGRVSSPLAVGARIMLNMNINKARGEVNGALGAIVRLCRTCVIVHGATMTVSPRRPAAERRP